MAIRGETQIQDDTVPKRKFTPELRAELDSLGKGDMLKSVYDTDDDGIVDNSEKLEGSTKAQVQDHPDKSGMTISDKTKLDRVEIEADVTGDHQADVDHINIQNIGTKTHIELETDISNIENYIYVRGITIDGGGQEISAGVKGDYKFFERYQILSWTLLADQTGSIVIDLWKDAWASYPPAVADSICGANKPTITVDVKAEGDATGWATDIINAEDTLRYNVESVTNITRVTLELKLVRSE